MSAATLQIEVVYAEAEVQHLVRLTLNDGATVREALEAACSNAAIRALNIQQHTIGVWGRAVTAETLLQEGDRVEIYRPLVADAKVARRQRAEEQLRNKAALKS